MFSTAESKIQVASYVALDFLLSRHDEDENWAKVGF